MAQTSNYTSAVLTRLQQFFIEGKLTDMIVRVRIIAEEQPQPPPQESQPPQPPAAKRQRTAETEAATAAAAADRYTDIKAHVLVLCARSRYFERALSGEWVEASERRVELAVKDEQELEDLQLLIKLSYAGSYTHDGDGQLLPLETRLRLAVRADGLEFVEAVDQVVASLHQGLGFEVAVRCLDELPQALETHAAIAAVRSEATNVLCAHLGPVAGMFEVGKLVDRSLPLREDVKQLPRSVLKRLLASEALQLQLENEAYILLVAWLDQSPHVSSAAERLVVFKELAPLLRYHHMTTDFLANIVCKCLMMQQSGLGLSVMHSAIAQRDALPSLLKEEQRGKRSRGIGVSSASWEFTASFTLEEVAALEPNKYISKWCGLMAGYPAYLRVDRGMDVGDTLGAYLGIHLPGAAVGVDDTLQAGVGLARIVTLSPDVEKKGVRFFSRQATSSWGWSNVFDKPWAEAVREGSPHFPGGQLEIKATVMLAVKK